MTSASLLPDGATSIFPGGGEVARLMRDLDWSATPLGDSGGWPQSLRSAVSLCLGSRFPIVLYWGPDLAVIYNDGYRTILGDKKHPLALGRPCRVVWQEIWDTIGPPLEGVIATGEATWSDDQLLMLRRHGYDEECYFTYSFSPIRVESGRVGGVFTAVTETTARVLSERRLRTLSQLSERLADAKSDEAVARAAVEAMTADPADVPFAALYLAAEDRSLRLAAATDIEGLEGLTPVVTLEADDAPRTLARVLATVLATGRDHVVGDLRLRSVDVSGAEALVTEAVVLPIAGSAGRPAAVLVAGVSPRRALDADYRSFYGLLADHVATALSNARAYQAEQRRADSLAELDRAKTAFFSNISHEFRTPLTLLLGPLEDLLARPGGMAPDVRSELELVRRNGLRMLRLVNTLLDFSRIEAGRASAVFVRTDLPAVTADLASLFRSAFDQAGLDLVVEAPPFPSGVSAYVDVEMWDKVVLNLLSNALKFTLAGSVHLRLRTDGRTIELEVRDTGVGIPAAELPHLFERFHRVEGARARTHEGSGIGLAVVRQLVELHGGRVTVESQIGNGTTFRVTLPAGREHLPQDRVADVPPGATPSVAGPFVEEALRWLPGDGPFVRVDPGVSSPEPSDGVDPGRAVEAGSAGPAGDPAGPARGRPRLLIADDNADMRDYLERLLATRYEVTACADGESALAAALERPPDLVLTDVMMPGLDGFQLLRALRAADRTRDIPVLLLSARAGEEARIDGLEMGADDYLVKPFASRELLARVASHLHLRQMREAVQRAHRRYHDLVEDIDAIVWEADAQTGEFRYVSRRAEEILGYPVDRWLAEPDFWADHLVAADREAALRSRVDGALLAEDHQLEYRMLAADGRSVWMRDTIHVVRDVDGRPSLLRGVMFDVTDRRRAEEAREAFIGVLSHELRTPITTILGAAHLLHDGSAHEDVDRAGLIGDIAAEADRLERLVEDLLVLSRSERGQLIVGPEPVLIAHVVRSAIAAESARYPDVTFTAELPPLPPVSADGTYVLQVLRNLLSNAAKYGPDGRSVVRIVGGLEGDAVAVRVLDDGPGFPSEARDRLFDLYFRADPSARRRPGAGIGLYVTRALVEAMGGRVWASLREGGGAEFGFALPLLAED